MDIVHRYEMAYLPEYWLGTAGTRTRNMSTRRFVRPSSARLSNGYHAGASVTQVQTVWVLDSGLLLTAAHCVSAVREAAGLDLQPLDLHPLPVQLLRAYPDFDITIDLKPQQPGEEAPVHTGSAACGTTAQFDTYVAKLKATG